MVVEAEIFDLGRSSIGLDREAMGLDLDIVIDIDSNAIAMPLKLR